MPNFRNKKVSLIILLSLGFVIFLISKGCEERKVKVNYSSSKSLKRNKKNQSDHRTTKKHQHIDLENENQLSEIKKQDASYGSDKEHVLKLIKKLPKSKEKLLDFIKSENRLVHAEPHSVNEKLMHKTGALKVMALRAVVEFSENPSDVENDLKDLAENAQDQTIKNLADAALRSHQDGRSFFKDFVDGIDTSMPE